MKHGFTLLELLVALFILAMLVGIAVPVYIDQMNKSEVAAALTTLEGIEHLAKTTYEENPNNNTITYNGIALNNGIVTGVNLPPVVNAMYIGPGGDANVASNQFLVCVYVDKLNFSGYVAPTSGSSGSYTRLCKLITASEPIYTNMCGALQGNSIDIPVKYLPTGCNCANIYGNSC